MPTVGQIPTQADKRRPMTFTDRFGRQYFASIEKASGYPTGLVQCLFEVPDPRLAPPQKFMRFPEDKPGLLEIDYDGWETELKEREDQWQNDRSRLVNTIPGGASNPYIAEVLGPRPLSVKLIRAMRQGNKWALGLSKIKPPEAEELLPTPVSLTDEPVFTETEPAVFSEPKADSPAGTTLAELLADVESRCPPELKGFARKQWAMKELERMAAQEV